MAGGRGKSLKSSGCCTDRISDLPDSVIGQILSCLPATDAVATSILSKRWKNLVDYAVKLDIDDFLLEQEEQLRNSFADFVDKLLINRTSSLDTLILKCNGSEDHSDAKVISWIRAALRLKVRSLNLNVAFDDPELSLFHSLNGCTSLSSLELTLHPSLDTGWDEQGTLCLHDDVSLPSLKSLTIHNVRVKDKEIYRLIAGCPVLEDFCMRQCYFECRGNIILSIRSRLLKRLSMQECYGKLCVDVPNLRVLSYDNQYTYYIQVVSDFKFLESARIGSSKVDTTGLARLIIACSNTTRLYLSSDAIDVLHRPFVDLPTYQNLTWLQLGHLQGQSGWEILLRLLYSAPNLKKLVFEKGYTKRGECLFSTLPICMGLHLKEIDFLEFSGDDSDFELIEFFLKNAKVLMKLKLHCAPINNSCVLDRLCRLSTKSTVFVTFSCWKDDELLKCRLNH